MNQELFEQLRLPFHPSHITWKPGAIKGERALAMPYADLRAYMNRLDEVCGYDWSVAYEPWGNDRIICRLTIGDVMRSSTGETTNESEKSEIGGTVAEAQAFKRACAMFGLGRYLYQLPTGWADWDAAGKKFTDKAKAKLTGILVQHYRRATGKNEADAENESPPQSRLWGIGQAVFGKEEWDAARHWLLPRWTAKATPDNTRASTSELSEDEKTLFGDYINSNAAKLQKLWATHKTETQSA
jgi:hypothetical protein